MATKQRPAHRQQRIEELCGAALRALTGDRDLHYRNRQLHRGRNLLRNHAPHLRADPQRDSFDALRGMVDSVSLRLRFSDANLHQRMVPAAPVDRLMFELLEQLRVETLAPDAAPGMVRNIRLRFRDWLKAFYDSGLTESALGILLFTVAQICWSRLTGQSVPEEMQDAAEATRAGIAPLLGSSLAGLRGHTDDQRAYAEHALRIAGIVGHMVREAMAESDGEDESNGDRREERLSNAFALLLESDVDETQFLPPVQSGERDLPQDAGHFYRIFTTRYDRRVRATSLVREELLRAHRQRLDRQIGTYRINYPRLVSQLTEVLAVPQRDGWSFEEESGHIDGRRLAQLVSSPGEHRVFRRNRYRPGADCVVGLLIDCSGSMKAHTESLAALVDMLVRGLEQARANTEVLGFTTGAWNGGRAHQDWLARGRPETPGRLNETILIEFKGADQKWRQARKGIAALLKTDLFREGVDGEAVEWACRRLAARPERRRMLIVVSDGSPRDSATALANGAFYLDDHLRQVVAHHEEEGVIEIMGLGVGLDLSPYYSRSIAIDLSRGADNGMFSEIVQLIGGKHRR